MKRKYKTKKSMCGTTIKQMEKKFGKNNFIVKKLKKIIKI